MAESDKLANRPWQITPMANITRVVPVDLSKGDYEDERGFFIRAGTTGSIKYYPKGNEDTEAITKEFEGSAIFVDPEICWKIFASGAGSPAAEDIYVGYGV